MKKNTKLIIAVIAFVVVVAALAAVYFGLRPQTSQGAKAFTVEVVHADGSSRTFTYHTDEEYVGTVLQAEGLLKGEMGQFGLYIHEVDGERAVFEENGAYWAFYVGEEYGNTGVDMTPVHDGDCFKLVYTLG